MFNYLNICYNKISNCAVEFIHTSQTEDLLKRYIGLVYAKINVLN